MSIHVSFSHINPHFFQIITKLYYMIKCRNIEYVGYKKRKSNINNKLNYYFTFDFIGV